MMESLDPRTALVPIDNLAILPQQGKASCQEGHTFTKQWSHIVMRTLHSPVCPVPAGHSGSVERCGRFPAVNLVERGLVTRKAYIYLTGAQICFRSTLLKLCTQSWREILLTWKDLWDQAKGCSQSRKESPSNSPIILLCFLPMCLTYLKPVGWHSVLILHFNLFP